jgi:dUTP pyrophosphatase
MRVKVVKINPEIKLPKYQTEGSAGMDIHSNIDKIMKPGEIFPLPTGLKFAIPSGYELQIRPRSGLAKKGLSMPNSPGTIDSDYRGELFVLMVNFSKDDIEIKKEDRIAQAVLKKHEVVEWEEVETLDETKRDSGGFGSTGL